jgi:hypothetical protein
MCKHTVKELKKIIMNYKKENCPAVSRARRDELLKIIEKLEIEVDQIKTLPQDLKKMFKKNEKLLNYSTKIPKSIKIKQLIGGDDLFDSIELSKDDFIKKIKELYPDGYNKLKQGLDEYDKSTDGLDMDKYLTKEIKKPVFFNNNFIKKLIKKDGKAFLKTRLKMYFLAINKNLKGKISIPSEILKPNSSIIVNKGGDSQPSERTKEVYEQMNKKNKK